MDHEKQEEAIQEQEENIQVIKEKEEQFETFEELEEQKEAFEEAKKMIEDVERKMEKFQAKRFETCDLLLETARAIDKVDRENNWGATGTTGVSMVGGVLTVVGGALTIATMGAAAPVLVAGGVMGVAGGVGGVLRNVLVDKKKSDHRSSAENAMDNLKKLEEDIKQSVISLFTMMATMTKDQLNSTQDLLSETKNVQVKKLLSSVKSSTNLQKIVTASVETAGFALTAAGRPALGVIGGEVMEQGAKSLGRAAGGVMIGLGAVFLIADGVNMTKTAIKLWKKEPDKAAEILRDLARRLGEEGQQEPGWDVVPRPDPDISCPVCWESLRNSEQSVLTTSCGHLFCSECIQQILSSSNMCPTCRNKISLKTCQRIYFP